MQRPSICLSARLKASSTLFCMGFILLGCDQSTPFVSAGSQAETYGAAQPLNRAYRQQPLALRGNCARTGPESDAFTRPVIVQQYFGDGACGSRLGNPRWYVVPAGVEIAPDGSAPVRDGERISEPAWPGNLISGPACKQIQTGNGGNTRFEVLSVFCPG